MIIKYADLNNNKCRYLSLILIAIIKKYKKKLITPCFYSFLEFTLSVVVNLIELT